jgi:hypothetical protein
MCKDKADSADLSIRRLNEKVPLVSTTGNTHMLDMSGNVPETDFQLV